MFEQRFQYLFAYNTFVETFIIISTDDEGNVMATKAGDTREAGPMS